MKFRLSRLARLRVVRSLAWLFALSLAFGGYAAAAKPLQGLAMASHVAHAHCPHHAAKAAKNMPAADDCCGVACACAVSHALGGGMAVSVVSRIGASSSPSRLRHTDIRGLHAKPPLRPPIA